MSVMYNITENRGKKERESCQADDVRLDLDFRILEKEYYNL